MSRLACSRGTSAPHTGSTSASVKDHGMSTAQARRDRVRRAVERLHGTFWLAHRAWALLTELRVIEAQSRPFISLRNAIRDSWAQTVVIETCKLFECNIRSASISTVQMLMQADGSLDI